jgi:hypothetical protein
MSQLLLRQLQLLTCKAPSEAVVMEDIWYEYLSNFDIRKLFCGESIQFSQLSTVPSTMFVDNFF